MKSEEMQVCSQCKTNNSINRTTCINCGASLIDETSLIDFELHKEKIIGDRYKIIKELGKGAMGVVYKAWDQKLDRFIALKAIKFEQNTPTKFEEIRKRMIVEAKAAAKLKHPNIVVIHDVAEIEKLNIHIAMELIDGVPLTEMILPGGYPDIDLIVDITIQICDAMSHAHENKIIHRDLKPLNILLVNKKTVKITDFGIAKNIDDRNTKFLKKALLIGTPSYMAPERFKGVEDDLRSDIYAIGVILYELLTGFKPYSGKSQEELVYKILNSKHATLKYSRADVPTFFENVISKALEKNPENRYQNALEFKSELLISYKDFVKEKEKRIMQISVWNVPFHRNINFTGREELLKKIREKLTSDEKELKIVAIHGLGGIGKTQVVLEFANRYRSSYKIVWWVRAEELSILSSEYASLANHLNLPTKYLKESEIINSVKKWLEENPGWLIVFDNAVNSNKLRDFIPENNTGHIIITSRNPKWSQTAKSLPLKKWSTEDSLEFLFKRTVEKDKNRAIELTSTLGNLPLALEQACAYIEETGRSVSEYSDIFKKYQKKLLTKGKPVDYPDTIATTWELSFVRIKKESPAGVELLNLCSFLAPDDIPLKMIKNGAEHLPLSLSEIVRDPLDFDDIIAAVRSYSLIDRTGDIISINRLVQTMISNRLAEKEKISWTEAIIKFLNDAFIFDKDEPETWKNCSRLTPHVLSIFEKIKSLNIKSKSLGELFYRSGFFQETQGKFNDAQVLYKQALSTFEKVYGLNHPEVAKVLRNIGFNYYCKGQYLKGIDIVERALDMDEKILGKEHPDVAQDLNSLGIIYWALHELDKAGVLFERAVKINMIHYESDHIVFAKILNNLGLLLFTQNKPEEALENYERALKIYEKKCGLMNYYVANIHNNLGFVHRKLGDLEKAEKMFEKALEIFESLLGSNHPMVANINVSKGIISRDLGLFNKALHLFEKALSINLITYGNKHTVYAANLTHIGDVMKDLGNNDDAREYYENALSILEELYKQDHPNVTGLINRLNDLSDQNN